MKKCIVLFIMFLSFSSSVTIQAQPDQNPDARPDAANLTSLIDYAEDNFTKKVIFQGKEYSIMLFAFQKGQQLKPHTIPIDAFVHVLEGTANVIIDGKEYVVQAGQKIVLPKDFPHALTARERFKMLLVK